MGGTIVCGDNYREKYIESEFKIEIEMREWECDLNLFDKSFYSILVKLNKKTYLDNIKMQKQHALNFFRKEYNSCYKIFEEILNYDIFKIYDEKGKVYDVEKLKLLTFLSCFSRDISKEIHIQDKAKYMFFYLCEDNIESTFERDNLNLKLFFDGIVKVTCVLISKRGYKS